MADEHTIESVEGLIVESEKIKNALDDLMQKAAFDPTVSMELDIAIIVFEEEFPGSTSKSITLEDKIKACHLWHSLQAELKKLPASIPINPILTTNERLNTDINAILADFVASADEMVNEIRTQPEASREDIDDIVRELEKEAQEKSKSYSLDEINEWLFEGKPNPKFPKSQLSVREQKKYEPKLSLSKLEPFGSGAVSGRVIVFPGGITDLQIPPGKRAAIATSNNGDLLTGCGYAIAKAVVNAAGAGLQKELYDRFGVPDVMEVPTFGAKKYDNTEGRGYAITCDAYDMKNTHNLERIEVLTVPMNDEDGLHNMYYEALVHSKDLDYIVLPMAGMTHPVLNNDYNKSATFSVDAVSRFIADYPDSKLCIVFATTDNVEAELAYQMGAIAADAHHIKKQYIYQNNTDSVNDEVDQVMAEIALTTAALNDRKALDMALENLLQGPRQKIQETKELEVICNALLAGDTTVACRHNLLGEIEVYVNNELYNLTQILKNADFEQLNLGDDKKYAEFLLNNAEYQPLVLYENNTCFPTEDIYAALDKENNQAALSYGEKLAITLYAGPEIYTVANKFLRSNGMAKEFESYSGNELTRIVKEVLLMSALATRGLNKLPDEDINSLVESGDNNLVYEKTYRVESVSDFNLQRIYDIETDQVTPQSGFTSTSPLLDIKDAINVDTSKPHVMIMLQRAKGQMPLGRSIKGIEAFEKEQEILYPTGTEFKYYNHHTEGLTEWLHGTPVRTIEHQRDVIQSEFVNEMRALRQEGIAMVERWIGVLKMMDGENLTPERYREILDNYSYLKWLSALVLTEEGYEYLRDLTDFLAQKAGYYINYDDVEAIQLDRNDIQILMMQACTCNQLETLKKLFSYDVCDANDLNTGCFFLQAATIAGSYKVAKYLIEQGVDPYKPLMYQSINAEVTALDLILMRNDMALQPNYTEFFMKLLLDAPSALPLHQLSQLNNATFVAKFESCVVDIIKSLPPDDPKRAEYFNKLQDPASVITRFFAEQVPKSTVSTSTAFFQAPNPVGRILDGLKRENIIDPVSAPKPD